MDIKNIAIIPIDEYIKLVKENDALKRAVRVEAVEWSSSLKVVVDTKAFEDYILEQINESSLESDYDITPTSKWYSYDVIIGKRKPSEADNDDTIQP